MPNSALLDPRAGAPDASHPEDFLDALAERMERETRRLWRALERTGSEFQRGGDELDLTSLRMGHEMEHALRAWCAEGLAERLSALDRLRKTPADFGRCEHCATLLPRERLEILPTARRCADC